MFPSLGFDNMQEEDAEKHRRESPPLRAREEQKLFESAERLSNGRANLSGVGEAAAEVVLIDPVLEVTDPERPHFLDGGGLVVALRSRRGGRPRLLVLCLRPLLVVGRGIHRLQALDRTLPTGETLSLSLLVGQGGGGEMVRCR